LLDEILQRFYQSGISDYVWLEYDKCFDD